MKKIILLAVVIAAFVAVPICYGKDKISSTSDWPSENEVALKANNTKEVKTVDEFYSEISKERGENQAECIERKLLLNKDLEKKLPDLQYRLITASPNRQIYAIKENIKDLKNRIGEYDSATVTTIYDAETGEELMQTVVGEPKNFTPPAGVTENWLIFNLNTRAGLSVLTGVSFNAKTSMTSG